MCSVSLTWEGKHLPTIGDQENVLQVVESIGPPSDNKLILGGNRDALPLLTGSADLIYIDPPFNTKKNWKLYTGEVAYSDKWDNDSHYFQVMYEQLILAHRALKDTGSLYLHCDYRVSSHLKIISDEIFGTGHMINQLIWQGSAGANSGSKKWIKTYDVILFYVKNKKAYAWNQQYQEYGEGGRSQYKYKDENGPFRLGDISNPGGGGYIYDLGYGEKPPGRGYSMPESTARRWLEEGILVVKKGSIPRKKVFTNPLGIPRRDIWSDISTSFHKDYPTQKPEKLLERIILASSNPGDIVLDFFCGSGTTLAVAEKLGRRWLGVDSSPIAIEVTKERLKKLGASFEILEVV